nr:hypothetical protein [uncultured Rhodopila sp.]
MTLKIPAPRLLPMTIATLAALLAVKSGVFLEAALSEGQPLRRWDVDPDGFPLDLPDPARTRKESVDA